MKTKDHLFNKLPGFVFHKRIDSVYLGCNQAMADLVGIVNPESIIGLRDEEIFEDQELANQYIKDDQTLLVKKTLTIIEPTQDKLGNSFQVLTTKSLDCTNEGEAKGIIVQAIVLPKQCQFNVTERKSLINTYTGLTRKESEIVYYLMRYYSMKEIGQKFHRSPRTIEKHIEKIKLKLGVNSKKAIIESIVNSNKNSLLSIN